MKRPSLSTRCNALMEGKIAELMALNGWSKAEISEQIGRSPDGLQRLGTNKKLGFLTLIEAATIAEAAGYEIEFRKA